MGSYRHIRYLPLLILAMLLTGCTSDCEPLASHDSEFWRMRGTSWVCNTNYSLHEIYISPAGDGVTHTYTSSLTGNTNVQYGEVVSENRAVLAYYGYSQEVVGRDNTFEITRVSDYTSIFAARLLNGDSSKDLQFSRVVKTIVCRAGSVIDRDMLGFDFHYQIKFYPRILFAVKDNLIATSEGIGYFFVTKEGESEEFAVKVLIRPNMTKKTDIVLYPYGNLLGFDLETVEQFFPSRVKKKHDNIIYFEPDGLTDNGFIESVDAVCTGGSSIVDGVTVRLNSSADIDGIITMLNSIYIDADDVVKQEGNRRFYLSTNIYGIKYLLVVETDSRILRYIPGADPEEPYYKEDFGPEISLN